MQNATTTNVELPSATIQSSAIPTANTTVPTRPGTAQHPNWCFTFNYDEGDEDFVREFWDELCTKAHYAIGGWEVAPTTGQRHLQGYVQFESKQRLSALKRLRNGAGIHWEPARGDEQQNIDYCSKAGNFITFGDEPRIINGGKRVKREWAETLNLCKQGKFEEIDAQIQITQCRNLEYIHKKYMTRPADLNPNTRMTWIWGPTGTGKSRTAREMMAGKEWYDKTQNKWWDHYNGEEFVLIDDLEKDYAVKLIAHLKRWLDIYPFVGEMKGSVQKYIRPKHIIITSNFSPEMIFDLPEWLEPIMRRCEVIYKGPVQLPPGPIAAVFVTPPRNDGPAVQTPRTHIIVNDESDEEEETVDLTNEEQEEVVNLC